MRCTQVVEKGSRSTRLLEKETNEQYKLGPEGTGEGGTVRAELEEVSHVNILDGMAAGYGC